MEVVPARMPVEVLERLRLLAHLRSLALGRTVTVSTLVRQMVEQHLRTHAEAVV
jgi:hypothetical protein